MEATILGFGFRVEVQGFGWFRAFRVEGCWEFLGIGVVNRIFHFLLH